MNAETPKSIKSNLFGSKSMWIVLVEIMLVLLITYYFANIFLMLIPVQNDIKQKTRLPIVGNVSKIASYNFIPVELFGRERKKTIAQPTKKVVQSKLNLKLNGTIQNKNKSLALISKSGSKVKVYTIGEKIMPGVTVSEIHNDNVILLHNAQSKILKMEKISDGQSIFRIK